MLASADAHALADVHAQARAFCELGTRRHDVALPPSGRVNVDQVWLGALRFPWSLALLLRAEECVSAEHSSRRQAPA